MKNRKPRLTPAECRYFDEVHQHVVHYNRHPNTMDQAFSDTHDGGLYECEVLPLVHKGFRSDSMAIGLIPMDSRSG